jgi:hypothetical protein
MDWRGHDDEKAMLCGLESICVALKIPFNLRSMYPFEIPCRYCGRNFMKKPGEKRSVCLRCPVLYPQLTTIPTYITSALASAPNDSAAVRHCRFVIMSRDGEVKLCGCEFPVNPKKARNPSMCERHHKFIRSIRKKHRRFLKTHGFVRCNAMGKRCSWCRKQIDKYGYIRTHHKIDTHILCCVCMVTQAVVTDVRRANGTPRVYIGDHRNPRARYTTPLRNYTPPSHKIPKRSRFMGMMWWRRNYAMMISDMPHAHVGILDLLRLPHHQNRKYNNSAHRWANAMYQSHQNKSIKDHIMAINRLLRIPFHLQ